MKSRLIGMGLMVVLMAAGSAWAASVSITVSGACDNYYSAAVYGPGGTMVTGSDIGTPNQDAQQWRTTQQATFSGSSDMAYVFAVVGHNYYADLADYGTSSNPAAFLGEIKDSSGRSVVTAPNTSWYVWYAGGVDLTDGSGNPITPPVDNQGRTWQNPAYNMATAILSGETVSRWHVATQLSDPLAPNGIGPWGFHDGISADAKWIWGDNAGWTYGSGGQVDTPVYMRTMFAVPEPITMIGAFMGISSLGMYIRKRTKVTA